jgi:hypothetical protein
MQGNVHQNKTHQLSGIMFVKKGEAYLSGAPFSTPLSKATKYQPSPTVSDIDQHASLLRRDKEVLADLKYYTRMEVCLPRTNTLTYYSTN